MERDPNYVRRSPLSQLDSMPRELCVLCSNYVFVIVECVVGFFHENLFFPSPAGILLWLCARGKKQNMPTLGKDYTFMTIFGAPLAASSCV